MNSKAGHTSSSQKYGNVYVWLAYSQHKYYFRVMEYYGV